MILVFLLHLSKKQMWPRNIVGPVSFSHFLHKDTGRHVYLVGDIHKPLPLFVEPVTYWDEWFSTYLRERKDSRIRVLMECGPHRIPENQGGILRRVQTLDPQSSHQHVRVDVRQDLTWYRVWFLWLCQWCHQKSRADELDQLPLPQRVSPHVGNRVAEHIHWPPWIQWWDRVHKEKFRPWECQVYLRAQLELWRIKPTPARLRQTLKSVQFFMNTMCFVMDRVIMAFILSEPRVAEHWVIVGDKHVDNIRTYLKQCQFSEIKRQRVSDELQRKW